MQIKILLITVSIVIIIELHGRLISVEKAKSESDSGTRRQTSRASEREGQDTQDQVCQYK